jgi:hypothetical protein
MKDNTQTKNQIPTCCEAKMELLGSDGPWWNTHDHYRCSICNKEILQQDHTDNPQRVNSNAR